MKKERKPKAQKETLSEEEIIRKEADRIVKQVEALRDTTKKSNKKNSITNTDLWLDSDFFFSVVFQSSQQKYAVLKKLSEMFGLEIDVSSDDRVQILNGVKLADALNVAIQKEKSLQYPYPDLELRKLVLDEEKF